MSFIIKGIDLPKDTDGLSINFHQKDGTIETHIIDREEVIEIPTPHGRIIDGDVLDQYIEGKGFVIGYKAIDDQKVILEAEGEER